MTPDPSAVDADLATLANWRTPPHSRWAFHHVDRLVASTAIAHDPDHVRLSPTAPRSLQAFRLPLPGGTTLDLANFLQATATDALLVVHRGAIVHETYAHGNDARTPHILMSVSKSIVGLVIGQLVDRGELDLEAEVSSTLPELADTAYRDASIRQLLDMRTGIRLDDAQLRAYANAGGWNPIEPDLPLGLRAFFETLRGPTVPHGGPFHYVSANTDLLGLVVERATGRSFASLAAERLWRPMGAEAGAYITVDRDGVPRCTGGFCATARDLARVGQLMIDGGRREGQAIVPQRWVDDVLQGGDREAWRSGEWGRSFAALSTNMRYRSGWYAIDDAPQTIFGLGIHGQHLCVDPTNELVIVKFSSQAEAIDHRAIGLTHRAVAAIRRCLVEG